jgi:serine/threonine protein phosphatase 1
MRKKVSRTLAIGDVHGCSRALDALLGDVQAQADDVLVFLGDYVDRGPDSFGVIERVLHLAKTCKVIPLRGNHEVMMLESHCDDGRMKEWLMCGGRETLASYSHFDDGGTLADVPDHHWEFLEKTCLDWHETDTHLFVHANAYPDAALADQPSYMLYWEQILPTQTPHESGKVLICGHTSQKSGLPLNLGHAVCIDTWPHGKGWLTCLETRSGKLWQANQSGKIRSAFLDNSAPGGLEYSWSS